MRRKQNFDRELEIKIRHLKIENYKERIEELKEYLQSQLNFQHELKKDLIEEYNDLQKEIETDNFRLGY